MSLCNTVSVLTLLKLYQQIDGISMGSSLGPLHANIIITELEQKTIKQFIDDKTLMFHGHQVDDTLVIIKLEDLNHVHNALNNFDCNLKLTFVTFNDVVPIFQILKYIQMVQEFIVNPPRQVNTLLFNIILILYIKGQYIIHRATVICDETKVQDELNRIKKLITWNGFPKWIGRTLITKKLEYQYSKQ